MHALKFGPHAMTRTSILACLFAFAASAAMAQAEPGNPGALSLDPGASGGTAGLISGGGTTSYNLDGRDARPAPASPRVQPSQAKAETDAKEERAKSRSRTARAQADDDNSGNNSRAKKAKKQPRYYYADPNSYSYGFGAFGRRGLFGSRD
jgi:hypothetical protein